MYNIHVWWSYRGRSCDLTNCNVTDTIIEERENAKRDKYEVYIDGGTFKNTTFKNLMGTGNAGSSDANYEFGIWLLNSGISLENCVFQGCAVGHLENASWKECSVLSSSVFADGQITFNECEFKSCVTRNSIRSMLSFIGCDIINSGTFAGCCKFLTGSYLETDFISPDNFKVGSTCDNSTICATGAAYQTSFQNIKFMNNSKIILEKYQHNKDIINSYSAEGVDYTIEYNGTELL